MRHETTDRGPAEPRSPKTCCRFDRIHFFNLPMRMHEKRTMSPRNATRPKQAAHQKSDANKSFRASAHFKNLRTPPHTVACSHRKQVTIGHQYLILRSPRYLGLHRQTDSKLFPFSKFLRSCIFFLILEVKLSNHHYCSSTSIHDNNIKKGYSPTTSIQFVC
jgi:hypothetical protein